MRIWEITVTHRVKAESLKQAYEKLARYELDIVYRRVQQLKEKTNTDEVKAISAKHKEIKA